MTQSEILTEMIIAFGYEKGGNIEIAQNLSKAAERVFNAMERNVLVVHDVSGKEKTVSIIKQQQSI